MPEQSGSGLLEGASVDEGRSVATDQSSPVSLLPEQPAARHGEEFDSLVEEIRRWYGWDSSPLPTLVDQIRRRLGVAPASPTAAAFAGVVGVGVRLTVVVLATGLVGEWVGIPWVPWVVILVFYAAFDASKQYIGPPPDVPPGPRVRRIMENWTALLPAIASESDLRDLSVFIRRWIRPLMSLAIGVATAAIMLTACWWVAPDAMSDLPVGSVVLLAWLLFDFGATVIYYGILASWAGMAREAKYDHNLFWASPADSPEVKKAMRRVTTQGSAAGFWITVFLVLTFVLVSWGSPLLVPLGAGFIVIGYLALFGAALGNRSSVQSIVQRVRERRLAGLQESIDEFGPNYAHLSPRESQQLRDLLFLHDKIRDAPTTPTSARTVMHTAAGLIIPTILFLATVFGEVYAERFFEAFLP